MRTRGAAGSRFPRQPRWIGWPDALLDLDTAIALFEQLPEQRVEFEEAFPGVQVEEA